jgi:uncharacterized protein (TIGR00269 family)
VRRHNAAFCRDHFLVHCRQQTQRAVERFGMFGPEDAVVVAVSGGKDSLMLWDVLLELGYRADGLYIGLGIGDYSSESQHKAEAFAKARDATLTVVDLAEVHGYDIPTGAKSARRPACGVCGLSKRYVMNQVALEAGYRVLATGHNLDDEAAVLFGNLLHWDMGALVRQRPVLEEADGFVRKVKPLVRLGERETAAYCFLAGIDYIVEECPMVSGNTGLRYKDALTDIESASPGTKAQLYFGFVERALPTFETARTEDPAHIHPCASCGAPTTAEICAFCRLRRRATDAGAGS